jgi:hypothetical protein
MSALCVGNAYKLRSVSESVSATPISIEPNPGLYILLFSFVDNRGGADITLPETFTGHESISVVSRSTRKFIPASFNIQRLNMARVAYHPQSSFNASLTVGSFTLLLPLLHRVKGCILITHVYILQATKRWATTLGIWGVGAGTAALFVCRFQLYFRDPTHPIPSFFL